MESIHGSKLGAAMLEAKLAPPLPPPRSTKPKNKKRAPSPPGDRSAFPDYRHESPSPVSLKDLGGSLDRKKKRKLSSSSLVTENYSKFDLFRLDLYEKINRMREGSTETEVTVLEMNDAKRCKDNIDLSSSNMLTLEYPSGQEDAKISRRELLYKLQESETVEDEEQSHLAKLKVKRNKSIGMEEKEYSSWSPLPCAGAGIDEGVVSEQNAGYDSRPSTAMSNSSDRTSHTSAVKEKAPACDNRAAMERDDLSECSETSDASLSGDSLNSSFRKPIKHTSLKSKNSLRSSEDLSVISGSSVITSSTGIKEMEDYDEEEDDEMDDTTQDDDSRLSTDLDAEMYSLDESEHPSLEEYLQLSSQVARKLSERTVPVFSTDSPKEKNVISQFMKEFKTTIGRLKAAEDSKPRTARASSPGKDNWTLKKEEKKAKVARKVSIFKRNPLKGRKNEEPLVATEEKSAYFFDATVSETDDAGSSSRSSNSSVNGKKGRQRYKNKTPEIVPAGEKNESRNGEMGLRDNKKNGHVSKITIPRVGKAVTPPLPPPKPRMDHLQLKNNTSFKNSHQESGANQYNLQNSVLETVTDDTSKSGARFVRTPSIESDSISVANSDMTEDSLNTPIPHRDEDDNQEDISEDENGPIDRCLAQLEGSVIQPQDDCSLNQYLNHLGNVLATREDYQLDQCLSKLASNMNGNRATKGFNLSHLPLCTWEHVCVDKGSDRSTPTSDRSSTTSRGSRSSQENLRRKTLIKSKHHHHHAVECKHNNDENLQTNNSLQNGNHAANGCLFTNGGDPLAKHILVERVVQKGLIKSNVQCPQIASTSEECGRASSLGSTRELETPIPETSDPGSADLERPRKKRQLFRRSKKGLNGTCRQHIQNNKLSKKENGALSKELQNRNSNTPRSSSSDVTVIQLGDSNEHVTNIDSSNTFVTLINVDSSDCSNSAEEK